MLLVVLVTVAAVALLLGFLHVIGLVVGLAVAVVAVLLAVLLSRGLGAGWRL